MNVTSLESLSIALFRHMGRIMTKAETAEADLIYDDHHKLRGGCNQQQQQHMEQSWGLAAAQSGVGVGRRQNMHCLDGLGC